MSNVKPLKAGSLTSSQHIAAAEQSIFDGEQHDDSQAAIAEAQLAQAHILAAFAKMAQEFIGGKRPMGSTALGLVAKLAR